MESVHVKPNHIFINLMYFYVIAFLFHTHTLSRVFLMVNLNPKFQKKLNCNFAPLHKSISLCQNIQTRNPHVTKTSTGMYILYNMDQYFWHQKLKRSIKSCGESDTVQLSGLLAVQGWFVSFQKRMWQCVQKCKVSLYCSLCG